MNCPCESKIEYAQCCEPFHKGKSAPTAEKLMRSRYAAFVVEDFNYIEDTHNPDTIDDFDMDETAEWAEDTDWCGLEIINTEKGSEKDKKGIVEFRASFKTEAGQLMGHHEVSEFDRKDKKWFYTSGKVINDTTVFNTEPKIGRNDPCTCGSGKKYKKCCANK